MIRNRTLRARDNLWAMLTGGDPAAELELSQRLAWSRKYLRAVHQGRSAPPPPEPKALKRTASRG
jgi:hypothetical protein